MKGGGFVHVGASDLLSTSSFFHTQDWQGVIIRAADLAATDQRAVAAAKQQRAADKRSKSKQSAVGELPDDGEGHASSIPPPSEEQDTLGGNHTPGLRHGTLVEGLTRAFNGVSPSLVEQLCAACGPGGPSPWAEAATGMDASQWTALHTQWQAWLLR